MKLSSYIWTTKDGEKLNIKDMKDSHIFNCIIGLKERRIYPLREKRRKKWIIIFNTELRIRKLKNIL
jgi:hypothetical protein